MHSEVCTLLVLNFNIVPSIHVWCGFVSDPTARVS